MRLIEVLAVFSLNYQRITNSTLLHFVVISLKEPKSDGTRKIKNYIRLSIALKYRGISFKDQKI